jgi:hypothetical protein
VSSRTSTHQPSRAAVDAARERILVRRRNALMILGGLVFVTLVLALVTGSVLVLLLNLIADVGLAIYIAYLLQLKQGRGVG